MANKNLFEKYGIKEVADVTLYRIEKKEETYESQRQISAASVLRGALELRDVYPLTETGIGDTEGFKAYVFTDAMINEGVDYDCDETTLGEDDNVGTHEYSYAEQVAMLFAKRQNLITKTGVRYQFEDADEMFGNIDFDDNFAASPYSNEKIVVVGVAGKFDDSNYDLEEVNEVISQLKETLTAKAYDVTYNDYAELVVNDEMGYYNPAFLGGSYSKATGVTFFAEGEYKTTYGKKADNAIADAEMWDKNTHYSINDAIDALKQKKLVLDASAESNAKGIDKIFGGYKVNDVKPTPGTKDDSETYPDNTYSYEINGDAAEDKDGNAVTSDFELNEVNEALNKISNTGAALSKDLEVITTGTSNRAIYVRVDGAVDTSAGAYIYLLKNKNAKKLLLDEDGIFKFTDKKGNKLFYQDKIFAGIETLALVVIGDKGLIFVVNRYGGKNNSRVAWMVSDNGYVSDSKAKFLVNNGLIHTTYITANDETFEATCTVGNLKVHKTVKQAKRYIPVLFLDTLKVSTIEQTAEEVFATGGKGNANLVGWDYGKEITLTIQDALFTPASMSAIYGSYENGDFRNGVKEAKTIDRMEKCTAKRNFIVPAGNQNGLPSEADKTAQAVFVDPKTMEPYQDGTPIVEGEIFLKWTRSVAYEGQSLGSVIEISADKFPGVYKVVGDTCIKNKETGKEERFQFVIPEAKMGAEETITLEADGDPAVFDFNMKVLRPEDGVMVRFIQYNVVENEEENDGSTMVEDTENLNLLDDAELFRVSADNKDDEDAIGATEY